MNNRIQIKALNLFLAVILIVGQVFFALPSIVFANSGESAIVGIKVVDKEGGFLTDTTIESTVGETALELLKRAVGEENVGLASSAWGDYLVSIQGVAAEGTYYWSFLVNGEMAQVGVGSYEIQDGDQLEFKYVSWSTKANVKVSGKNGAELTNMEVDITRGETALEVLKRAAGEENVGIESSAWGDYVVSIHGVVAEGTYYWSFLVNGEMAQVGAGSYAVDYGDQLEFKYISWDTGDGEDPTDPDDGDRHQREEPTSYDLAKLQEIEKIIADVSTDVLSKGITSDWDVIAVSLAGKKVSQSYLDQLVAEIKKKDGVFSSATDYARTILTAKALGANPEKIGGHNLVEKLYSYDNLSQYNNGLIYALIALDSGSYTIPDDAKWSKTTILQTLLQKQNTDGGWNWFGSNESDVDVTGMALTALASYTEKPEVQEAIHKALAFLTQKQQDSGGFNVSGDPVPTVAQAIIGLTSVGKSPSNTEFTKQNHTLIDTLLSYYKENEKRFYHQQASSSMATQQALQALVSYKHFIEKKSLMYHFDGQFGTKPDSGTNPGTNPSDPSDQKTIKVTIRGLNGANILDTSVTVTGKATAYGVLLEAVGTENVKVSGSGENVYIKEIKGLAEFDHGPKSGWNYSVNQTFPTVSAGAYTLSNGDHVRWLYTTNLGSDVGGGSGSTGSTVAPVMTEEKLQEQRNKTEEAVKALAGLEKDNRQSVRQFAKTIVVLQNERMTQAEADKLKEEIKNSSVKESKRVTSQQETIIADSAYLVSLIVPKEALQSEQTIQIEKLSSQAVNKKELVSPVYQFGPSGITFEKPVYVSIRVPLEVSDLEKLALVWLDEEKNEWIPIPAVLDPKTGLVTGLVNHFTKFAVIDRTKLETANEQAKVKEQIKETAQFLTKHQEGSEWALFALARAGAPVAHRSIEQLEREVQENQGTYRNVTDIERLVLTLSALGKDPRVFAGYDLIEKLYQHERMTHQGSNGLIFALIALDSKSYELPSHATWTRERIIAELLSYQNSTGAFSLAKGHENNVDITAMALAALAPYQKQKEVKEAVDKAVKWLSTEQQANGGYRQDMVESSESIAQVVIGLTALGIDPVGEAFTKEKGHLLTRLFAFKNTDGGFATQVGKASDQMPTEQALMALVAYERFLAGQSRLYDLKEINVGSQLPNGETEKKALFADDALISPYAYEAVYRALELRIFEGVSKDELRFAPKQDLTRAQFTKVILQLMKEEPAGQGNGNHPFVDVTPDAWYFHNVTRAAELGIVQGTAPTTFDPHASITREHLALMIGRALKLDASASGHQYKDIQHLSSESQAYIAVLHERGIMIGNGEKFHPHQKVTREMAAVIAVRLYEMMNP